MLGLFPFERNNLRQPRAVEPAQVQTPDRFHQRRIADGQKDAALAAAGIGGVCARFHDLLQICKLHLPLLILANGASVFHQFQQFHVQTSFQHCGSGA